MDARRIIAHLRDGQTPTRDELGWFARGLADRSVSDAQAGAFAMAALLNGLGEEGRVALTLAMRDSGDVLWEFDTNAPVAAVNGITATGGGMSGAGIAVADGHVISNSGYGLYFHSPGNMLAVFSVDGE